MWACGDCFGWCPQTSLRETCQCPPSPPPGVAFMEKFENFTTVISRGRHPPGLHLLSWGDYGDRLKCLMPDLSQTYGGVFLTHEAMRGSEEISVSGSCGLEVRGQEKLWKRKCLPPLVVPGPQLLSRAQHLPEP